MNRRTFLRSIATAYGAAVVCPGELVKKKKHPGIVKIPGWPQKPGFYDVTHLIKKGLPKLEWKHYWISYHYETTQTQDI